MAQKSKICQHCGRHFAPCTFNKHHQVYCTDDHCRRERARARKRKYYNTRYCNDADFQDAERQRCRTNIRQRREQARKKPPPAPASPLDAVNIDLVLAGFLAQALDTVDHHDVLYLAREYEARGQALSTATALAAPNAVLNPAKSVPRHSLSLKTAVPRHSPPAAPP